MFSQSLHIEPTNIQKTNKKTLPHKPTGTHTTLASTCPHQNENKSQHIIQHSTPPPSLAPVVFTFPLVACHVAPLDSASTRPPTYPALPSLNVPLKQDQSSRWVQAQKTFQQFHGLMQAPHFITLPVVPHECECLAAAVSRTRSRKHPIHQNLGSAVGTHTACFRD